MIDYLQYTSVKNEKGEIATDLININKLKEDTISNLILDKITKTAFF